jgi:carboxyl-terminal processing protease
MSKALLKGLFAVAAVAALFLSQARAADDTKSQTYVVVVGIDQYKDAQILPRKHAEADAQMLFDVFTDPGYLGVDADRVRLLLGKDDPQRKSQPATKENILKSLNWLVDNANKDDLVLFVYLGEGGAVGERTCYFTVDSTFKDRAKTALNAGDIENVLDKLKCHHFCAFVDVNFHGFNPGKEKVADPDLAKFYRELLGKDDEVGPPQSRVIFMPNAGLKPSLDLTDHGIFAKVLADGLKGKADHFGYEPDGLITVDEMIKYVRKELPELARASGKTDEEKAQQPLILEGHLSDFVLDLNPAITGLNKKRIEQFEKIAKANSFSKAIAEEGKNYLSRMPKLEAQQDLRKTYQKLADGTTTADQFLAQREKILAGTKLDREAAAQYARKVMSATDIVMHYYFKKLTPSQLVEAAVRGMYKHLDETVPSSVKEKLDNIKNLEKADLLTLLTDARVHLGKREDLADGKDVTVSLHPMMGKLDRHSDYIDPETLARFKIELQGKFSGIGVQIRKNNTRDQLQVITPIMGSPAYKAKIYAGDIITHIVREVDTEGNPLPAPETIPTKGMTTDEAVKKIVGKEGTKVKIIVEREGEPQPLEFNLIRGSVELETVLGHKRNTNDAWDYVIDPENQICYVRLTGFQENTGRDLEQLMKKLYKAGIKGFILDLRFNPGGLLDQAVKISDLFIDDGMIVTIKPRVGPETSYMGRSEGSYTAFPMVCLVNGYSASASEIVSACLQDHGRAVIMGSRSYGKGSVQTILPFRETGAQIKVTTATFWRPSGKNLNKASTSGKDEEDWGVKPDKGFDLPLAVKDLNDLQDYQRDREIIARPGGKAPAVNAQFQDKQLDMALDYLRGQIKLANQGGAKKAGG